MQLPVPAPSSVPDTRFTYKRVFLRALLVLLPRSAPVLLPPARASSKSSSLQPPTARARAVRAAAKGEYAGTLGYLALMFAQLTPALARDSAEAEAVAACAGSRPHASRISLGGKYPVS